MSGTSKKILAGLLLFLSGLVVGSFGARLWHERGALALLHGDSRRFAELVVRHLSADLALTPEQRSKLRPIVMETAKRLGEIRREQEPKIQAAMDADTKAIKEILTPEQQEKFEAILRHLKERRQALERFGPPPPPPPGDPLGPLPPPPDGMQARQENPFAQGRRGADAADDRKGHHRGIEQPPVIGIDIVELLHHEHAVRR